MIAAIVLAAGRSSRMGRPKALLACGADGETFVSRLVRSITATGIAEAIVVGRPEDSALRSELVPWGPAARMVENPDADRGQLSSLLAGLSVADRPGVHGVLVMPVDMPLVLPGTIARVADVFAVAPAAPIVRAVSQGRHGHPVIFPRRLFDALRRADPAEGAKAVIRAHEHEIVNVEVDDPGAVRDIDLPADYEALFGSRP